MPPAVELLNEEEVVTLSQIFPQTVIFRKVFFILYSISLTSLGEAGNLQWAGGREMGQTAS